MGVFDSVVDAVEETLESAAAVLSPDVTTRDVARLIAAGMSVAAIAEACGVAEAVIESMAEDA